MFGGVLLGFEPKSIQSAPGPTDEHVLSAVGGTIHQISV